MPLKQKHKIWGSHLLGVLVFASSLVLTPRLFIDSSASATPDQVPVQSIQPFSRHPFPCQNCSLDINPKKPRCLTDTTPDHSILWNSPDETDLPEYTECEPAPSDSLEPIQF